MDSRNEVVLYKESNKKGNYITLPYSHLVLSGGGLPGVAYAGALSYLQNCNADIRFVYGTSIGAFFGFLYSLKIPMSEVIAYLGIYLINNETIDFGDFTDAMIRLINKTGLTDTKRFRKPLQHLLKTTYNLEDITFIDLTKLTGISLSVVATDIINHKSVHFNVDTTPNISVLDAVVASMCIPLVFTPVKINNCQYLDGGVFDNFPIEHLTVNPETVLGLHIIHKNYKEEQPLSLFKLISSISACVKTKTTLDQVSKTYKHICCFTDSPVELFPLIIREGRIYFDCPEKTIMEMYNNGYKIMDKFITSSVVL